MPVGVLSESASQRYLKSNFTEEEVKVIDLSDEGITGVLSMVRQGTLDATVMYVFIPSLPCFWLTQCVKFNELNVSVGQASRKHKIL